MYSPLGRRRSSQLSQHRRSSRIGVVAARAEFEGTPAEIGDAGDVVSAKLDNAHIAAGKAISYLLKMEQEGYCGVERRSVYGAAVAIPQIARSVGWSTSFTGLAVRSYIFLTFNIFLQVFLLSMLNEELHLFNPLQGRMHLCDFGASISGCPDGPNCVGPAGTEYTYARLYGFTVWNMRMFAHDSVERLFPERADEIDQLMDPGEVGVEDYYCRLVCCLLFMMAVMEDLKGTLGLCTLLQQVPTEAENWIVYQPPAWADVKRAKEVKGWTELDLVKFKVAGMPMRWKAVNFAVIVVPKTFIWWTLVTSGFHFLLETPNIIDCVVNCMALTFILDIDETVFARLATVAAKHMMEKLEDMALFETHIEEQETEEQAVLRFQRQEFGSGSIRRLLKVIVPKRLLWILAIMVYFVTQYYFQNCLRTQDGSWVSKDVYAPRMFTYNPMLFFFESLVPKEEHPMWTMPSPRPAPGQEL